MKVTPTSLSAGALLLVACAHAQISPSQPKNSWPVATGSAIVDTSSATCKAALPLLVDTDRPRWIRGCDAGDATACHTAWAMLECGVGGDRDGASALIYSTRGCEFGNAEACNNAGLVLNQRGEFGHGVPLLKKACDGGSAWGCTNLAQVYARGVPGVEPDGTRALTLLTSACEREHFMVACANVAALYAQGGSGIVVDDGKAFDYAQRACDGGNTISCGTVGVFYYTGRVVAKDASRAANLFDAACTAGGAAACSNLGNLYLAGDGVGRDAAHAQELYKKGCELGYHAACK